MAMNDATSEDAHLEDASLAILVANQQRFHAFLKRRLGSAAAAEEVLQEAFLRGIERGGTLRDRESVVAWFYRLLRNAVAEHHRRKASEARAVERLASEVPEFAEPDGELEATICACVGDMLRALPAQYREMLEAVDLRGEPVASVAARLGITANNASVRLHRARVRLGRAIEQACGVCCRDNCFDCECDAEGRPLEAV